MGKMPKQVSQFDRTIRSRDAYEVMEQPYSEAPYNMQMGNAYNRFQNEEQRQRAAVARRNGNKERSPM